MLTLIGRYGRHLALATALVATLTSLYFSLVLLWPPCDLCWYQRICMYPLVPILAVSVWRKSADTEAYVLPLALVGAGFALYHYLIQKTTLFAPPICLSGVSCTTDNLNLFGFITIPLLSFVAFVLISALVILAGWQSADEAETARAGKATSR